MTQTTTSQASTDDLAHVAELLRGRRIAVLTGAGISTDSGIPAYRGLGAPPRRNPMTIDRFLEGEEARRRYWLGGHLGWRAFTAAEPNDAHRALARMERRGQVSGVITQNVDGLHLRAGSLRVVEVHGTVMRVQCLECRQVFDRRDVAAHIEARNPWVRIPDEIELNPDGDVTPRTAERFEVPTCTVCDGMLKPDVVFFGEYVPSDRFRAAASMLQASDAMIVAGSSLVVNSGVRLVERMRRREVPLIIINHEATRADPWADAVIRVGTGQAIPALEHLLGIEERNSTK